MAKTRDELVERALKLLGVLAAGQSANAEDKETVDGQIEPVLAELSALRIVYVGDPSEYDDEYFNSIAECVAISVENDFGADLSRLKDRDGVPLAHERLKKMTRRSGTGEMLKTDELTGLNRRGHWYDWTIS